MYHTIIIAGYLGNDPDMRYTADGQPVTTFSLATSRRWTRANGEVVDETIWFRVSVFGRQAESCNQYLKKGRPALVEGHLKPDPKTGQPRVYQRKDDSTYSASYDVTASSVRFLSSSKGDSHSGVEVDDMDGGLEPSDGPLPF